MAHSEDVSHTPLQIPSITLPSPKGNALNLQFVLHPTFESCSAGDIVETCTATKLESQYQECVLVTCRILGLTIAHLEKLFQRFFNTFTSFQLFRNSGWQKKLRQIPTSSQRTALYAAVLAWAVKGLDEDAVNELLGGSCVMKFSGEPSVHFRAVSIRYMEEAINECWDEPISLHLLQTMILNTHCLLVQGVRGRAWRYLGICIRIGYELNLHLIDARGVGVTDEDDFHTLDVERWCLEEEWRRAWWAIWEMDVYASVVRRCPAGIDWSQNETCLPAEDEKWFRGEYQKSCPLELNPLERWKNLAATNNRSSKAWYIVINSLMKDAQRISSPVNVDKARSQSSPRMMNTSYGPSPCTGRKMTQKHQESMKKLTILLNALHCAHMAMPDELKYYGQRLSFGGDSTDCPDVGMRNRRCSSIYSIYVMYEFTKIMALKYQVFHGGLEWTPDNSSDGDDGTHALRVTDPRHLERYFEAADNIVGLIRNTSEQHYKYINPVLASAVWLVGALQLMQYGLISDSCTEKDVFISNFELVSLLYRSFVDFWNMSRIPLQNWETLKRGLENINHDGQGGEEFQYETPCVFTAGNFGQRPTLRPANNQFGPHSGLYDPQTVPRMGMELDDTDKLSSVPQGSVEPSAMSERSITSPWDTEVNSITASSVNDHQSELTRNGNLTTQTLLQGSTPCQQCADSSLSCIHNDLARGELANGVPTQKLPGPIGTTLSVGLDRHAVPPPSVFDPVHLDYDWTINMDFSNYLDEVLSGSYLP